eukprot:TRINITY_DN2860_c1_g2_i1.p2 TRINITY_DN2860_c1_g2~~TRINITY_DN2860_c1_g2_i1.p2  ORF type:complete len:118 (+),score=9.80 TRINITY_DN2860_c1_g2_i1:261-614(+)
MQSAKIISYMRQVINQLNYTGRKALGQVKCNYSSSNESEESQSDKQASQKSNKHYLKQTEDKLLKKKSKAIAPRKISKYSQFENANNYRDLLRSAPRGNWFAQKSSMGTSPDEEIFQ